MLLRVSLVHQFPRALWRQASGGWVAAAFAAPRGFGLVAPGFAADWLVGALGVGLLVGRRGYGRLPGSSGCGQADDFSPDLLLRLVGLLPGGTERMQSRLLTVCSLPIRS